MHQNKRIIMWLRNEYGEGNDNVKTVIEALEKQIPKKPVKDQVVTSQDIFTGNVTTDDTFNCPNCESFIGYVTDCTGEYSEPYQVAYCQGCGQKISWDEEPSAYKGE